VIIPVEEPLRVGLIGGSGWEQLPNIAGWRRTRRPWPDAPRHGGALYRFDADGGRRVQVYFVPRHGDDHQLAPHQVPYRQNLLALKAAGVSSIVATCITGSVSRWVLPGTVVIPDQIVDFTYGRDTGPEQLVHTPMARPYCNRLRRGLYAAVRHSRIRARRRGTVTVIQGPRFSTVAEVAFFRRQGWHLVNMTQAPEAFIARELGLCYGAIASVTDFAPGIARHREIASDASVADTLAIFHRSRGVVAAAVGRWLDRDAPALVDCGCARPFPKEYYLE